MDAFIVGLIAGMGYAVMASRVIHITHVRDAMRRVGLAPASYWLVFASTNRIEQEYDKIIDQVTHARKND